MHGDRIVRVREAHSCVIPPAAGAGQLCCSSSGIVNFLVQTADTHCWRRTRQKKTEKRRRLYNATNEKERE